MLAAIGSFAGAFARAAAEEDGGGGFARFDVELWQWGAFVAFVTTLLLLDLLVLHRKPKVLPVRAAAIECAVWISIGLSFTLLMLWWQGTLAAGEYLQGYLIEQSLSVDNVFVWAVIFSFFAVPAKYQFRVLFWGIFGALVLRAAFIFAGVALIERFDWILYIFGAFLLYTAWRIATHEETEVHPEHNLALRMVRKVIPTTSDYDGQKLFTRRTGRLLATPLFAVLIMVESTDVVFAVDSVPAILAVAREQFIVFSSNALAILGLRALYFLLAGMAGKVRYLNEGLGIILAFVGVKMLLADVIHLPSWASLTVISLVLAGAIALSLWADRREAAAESVEKDDGRPEDRQPQSRTSEK